MSFPVRCRNSSCRHRRKATMQPHQYKRVPPCPVCGSRKGWRIEAFVNKSPQCTCSGYPFKHRLNSPNCVHVVYDRHMKRLVKPLVFAQVENSGNLVLFVRGDGLGYCIAQNAGHARMIAYKTMIESWDYALSLPVTSPCDALGLQSCKPAFVTLLTWFLGDWIEVDPQDVFDLPFYALTQGDDDKLGMVGRIELTHPYLVGGQYRLMPDDRLIQDDLFQ